MNTDTVKFDVCIDRIIPKETEEEDIIERFPDVIDAVYEVLIAGPTWEFNPTNALLRKNSESLEIDKNKLIEYMKKECYFKVEDLDVNNDFVSMQIPIELLIANFRDNSNEIVSKSDYYTVTTLFGEINL